MTYHVVAHSNEEVEEELTTLLHFVLHGAASLEVVAAADDESKKVATKATIRLRGVIISPSSGAQDGADLYAGL